MALIYMGSFYMHEERTGTRMNGLMDHKRDGDILINALIFSLLAMLIPMVLATRLLNNVTYLAPLYAVCYIVQFGVLLITYIRIRVVASNSSLVTALIYGFLLAFPLINDLVSGYPSNYFDGFNAMVKIVNFLMLYAFMKNVSICKKSLIKFMRFIVILSVVACLFTLLFEWSTILSIRGASNTNAIDIISLFSNRNQFSAFLVVAVVANIYLCVGEKKRKGNYIVFALQLFCVLVTFSRSALFAIIALFVILLLQSRDKRKKIVTFIACVFLILAIFMNTGLIDYISRNYVRLANFDTGRIEIWKYGWDIIKNNIFTGVGFYTGVDMARSSGMDHSQFHSIYVDLLVDGGIFELVFILCIIYSVYNRCVKNCKERKYVQIYRASLFAFLLQACVESFSIFALSYSDTLYTLFYISVPLLLANMRDTRGASSS